MNAGRSDRGRHPADAGGGFGDRSSVAGFLLAKLASRGSFPHALVLVLLIAAAVFAGVAHAAQAVIVDRSKIYFGNPRKFEKPATIQRMRVYDEIPAYQRIKEKRLKPTDTDYYFLVAEASKVFRATVTRVAVANSYDLVAEESAIVTSGITVPDATSAAIEQIRSE